MAHTATNHDITALLTAWQTGDVAAFDEMIPLVYEELRRLAHAHRRREDGDQTLDTTALVHEAYLNLAGSAPQLNDRHHFYGVAARVMRRVLVWSARRRGAEKRGGGNRPESLSNQDVAAAQEDVATMLSVDAALNELEASNERQCRVVECRYFSGMTVAETAAALDISPATVKRDWDAARTWLETRLSDEA